MDAPLASLTFCWYLLVHRCSILKDKIEFGPSGPILLFFTRHSRDLTLLSPSSPQALFSVVVRVPASTRSPRIAQSLLFPSADFTA